MNEGDCWMIVDESCYNLKADYSSEKVSDWVSTNWEKWAIFIVTGENCEYA